MLHYVAVAARVSSRALFCYNYSKFAFSLEVLQRISRCNMSEATQILVPPECVKGMKILDRSQFTKKLQIPFVSIKSDKLGQVMKYLKPYLLKVTHLKPVQSAEDELEKKIILLDPDLVKDFKCIRDQVDAEVDVGSFSSMIVELGYDNWSIDDVFKSVLPLDQTGLTSYSRIGHIVHLNLREHLTDFRFLIGQVLVDKLKGVTCVVNKVNTVEGTFRNFKMEVLAGERSTVVNVRENGCNYEFDFAEVFWNPRLCTEHERIIAKLNAEDVVYDVFAGVGPFAIPAGKKGCRVLANDLNLHSYQWLQKNINLNKVADRVIAYNMDGRDFILEIIRSDLTSYWKANGSSTKFHVIMNLPAIAVTFLDAFRGLLADSEEYFKYDSVEVRLHCYCFVKEGNLNETAMKMIEDAISEKLCTGYDVAYVRSVAPNKEMMRVSFSLNKTVLCRKLEAPRLLTKRWELGASNVDIDTEPPSKRQCTHLSTKEIL